MIQGTAYVTNANSTAATRERFEPLHAGQAFGRSLWWTWTPATDGIVRLSTRSSSIDTVLAVYTGSAVGNLKLLAENDDDPEGLRTSALAFDAVAGTQYCIAVDGYAGAGGIIVLALNQSAEVAHRILVHYHDGLLELEADNAAGGPLIVERSFDLIRWEALSTIPHNQTFSIQKSDLSAAPQAFFRTRTPNSL